MMAVYIMNDLLKALKKIQIINPPLPHELFFKKSLQLSDWIMELMQSLKWGFFSCMSMNLDQDG